MNGRGAWTSTGMPPGATGFYKLMNPVRVGAEPRKNDDFLAVNFGVKVIQMRINGLGWMPRLALDGIFGERTDIAVRFVQGIMGLAGDGSVGPKTMQALMWPPIQIDAGSLAKTIGGLVAAESAFDPGAVSYNYSATRGPDRGLVQINESANPSITVAQMFHHRFSFQYATKRIREALATYNNLDIAIASYNSPAWAQEWFRQGYPPNAGILAYVQKIKSWSPAS